MKDNERSLSFSVLIFFSVVVGNLVGTCGSYVIYLCMILGHEADF